MIYYVDASSPTFGDGSKQYPFRRIQQAADIALPGDEILVLPGIYREQVKPRHAGRADARIIYRSLEPLAAVITGAAEAKDWENIGSTVWRLCVDNALFCGNNPFAEKLSGDWLLPGFAHRGEVYLNHKSMYEAESPEKVLNPVRLEKSLEPDFSLYTWFARQEEGRTVITANFQGLDPNTEDVEISVRQNCFMPEENGIDYITLSGFTVREAATQWAPPTAYQDGMIGPHWAKGWIIEDCEIYESKCSGISLGKYLQPANDNKWLKWKYKDGTQNERDAICRAAAEGWDKEHIGSHVIRRCHIHDCGQTGIVGHLGGVFSLIEENHIHHINHKKNIGGAEIGGIKMHAAIDVTFRNNHIHHCTRGMWLDWQAQGTRVTGNLLHDNCHLTHLPGLTDEELAGAAIGIGEDIFVEVSHGPTLIDNNILLSMRALKLETQGVALVHNLVAGTIVGVGTGTNNGAVGLPSVRYTPYHTPHGTCVEGFMTILHGDCRIYNNIFIQPQIDQLYADYSRRTGAQPSGHQWDDFNTVAGTCVYDGFPTFGEWDKQFEGYVGMGAAGNTNKYYDHLPVWIGGNVYFNGARPYEKEEKSTVCEAPVRLSLNEEDGEWILETDLMDHLPCNARLLSTELLGMAFEPEQRYENPDGTPIVFDRDYNNRIRRGSFPAGPFTEIFHFRKAVL